MSNYRFSLQENEGGILKINVMISIIIPAYNSAKYLPETIDSILAQGMRDYEIIIIDDGSTDNTREVIDKFNAKIKYIYQKQKGAAAARNRGIRNSRGDYIAFLDADDIWLPQKIRLQMQYFNNNPEISIIYTDAQVFDERGLIWHSANRHMRMYSGKIYYKLFLENFIHTSSVILKRACLERVGLFDESLGPCEDYEFWLRLARDYEFAFINKPLVKYRLSSNSFSRGKAGFERMFNLAIKISEDIISEDHNLFEGSQYLIRQRFGKLYYRYGWRYFQINDFRNARDRFILSIKHNKLFLKSYLYLLLTIIPFKILSIIRYINRKIRLILRRIINYYRL